MAAAGREGVRVTRKLAYLALVGMIAFLPACHKNEQSGAKKLHPRVVSASRNALRNDLGPYEIAGNRFILQHVHRNDHCSRRHVQQQTALALRRRPHHAFDLHKLAVLDPGK